MIALEQPQADSRVLVRCCADLSDEMFGVRSLPFTPTAEANDTVVAAKLRYRAAQAAMIKAAAPGVTVVALGQGLFYTCLLYTSPSPRDS